jgi:hypothetical protein
MAVTQQPQGPARRSSRFWSRVHFLVRFLGLTGAAAAGVGLVLAAQENLLAGWDVARDAAVRTVERVSAGRAFELPVPAEYVSGYLVLAGAAAVLLALLVELLALAPRAAARRSATGVNALVQVGLAAVLLVGVNYFAFHHYLRVDWTRDARFTLAEGLRRDLASLDPGVETTVVVYQRHRMFGNFSDAPERGENAARGKATESAAERKVVEKVKDLADLLREVGPQLRVEVLDVEDENFEDRLRALAADVPELRKAVDAAPENSLFFYARRKADGRPVGRVQRLAFNDFYLLDKPASLSSGGGRGNLVLRAQGVGPFARRILGLEERRPRVGIAVIHEVLTTEGPPDYGLGGLRKALTERGFDVQDVVLKKWSRFGPPEAGASTPKERKLAGLEERDVILGFNLAGIERERERVRKAREIWAKAEKDDAARKLLAKQLADQLDGRELTVAMVRNAVQNIDAGLQDLGEEIDEYRRRQAEVREEKAKLNVPALQEQARVTDLKAKMDRLLADCDVLLLPRMTLRNVASDWENIPPRLHRIDDAQADAVKDFLRAGKPVLACFGPANAPPPGPGRPPEDDTKADNVEQLFADLGIRFGKQTVLFNTEVEAFADRRSGSEIAGSTAQAPPLQLDWPLPGAGYPPGWPPPPAEKPNRIREALNLVARSVGGADAFDLRLRHPRPVYYVPPKWAHPDFDPTFLLTSPAGWNEDQPFPTEDRVPQFERPKAKEGEKPPAAEQTGLETRRRGPFPVAVAVETPLPPEWTSSGGKSPTVRVAAIGQGGFFVGGELPPAQEVLLVDSLNWLLGRDDYLPRPGKEWSFPRVDLSEREQNLWWWGALVGLPALCLYVGINVLLMRRLR